MSDLVNQIAHIAFGGIIGLLAILILTGYVPLPGGLAPRLIVGLGAVGAAGLLILGVKLW